MKYILLLAIFFVVAETEAKKVFYKWTDSQGNIHYTETKPLNKKVDQVKIHKSKTKAKQKIPELKNNKSEEVKEKSAVDKYNEAAKEKAQKSQDRENCKIAKKNLLTLQQTVRVRQTNPATGEVIRMGDVQRVNAMKAMRKNIKQLCK